MGLIDMLINSGGGALLNQVQNHTGLDEDKTKDLLKTLGSAMLGQVKGRVESDRHDSTELEDLIKDSRYANMLDNPHEHLNDDRMRDRGNDLLRHITGNKETSREIASQVGNQIGIDPSIIKSLLPMLAPLIIGTLGKSMMGGSSSAAPSSEDSGGLLSSLLDFDNDGSVMDDIAGMAMKYLM